MSTEEKWTEIQKKYLEDLFKLIKENPDLPVVPMVDEQVVADDDYGWWLGSWGKSQIEKYYRGEERYFFYDPEVDWDEMQDVVEEAAAPGDNINFEEMSEEEAQAAYEAVPWVTAIIVYIRTP